MRVIRGQTHSPSESGTHPYDYEREYPPNRLPFRRDLDAIAFTYLIMRSYGILLVLGLLLAFIAFQARTGIFRAKHSGEPANKYMRQIMENPQLSVEDAAILREKYGTAHTTPTGLRYLRHSTGTGNPPALGSEAVVHYDAYLLNGTKFDSTRDRGSPYAFRVGGGKAIKGLDEAVSTMKLGEKRTVIIPWWLGFGDAGKGPVPPRATLLFELELIDIR